MREIKFRAWDGKNLRYDVTGLEHGEKNEMAGVFLDGDFWKVGHPEEILKTYDRCATLMQFTGLRDKNGVEIYEGDIVKSHHDGNSYPIVFGSCELRDSRGELEGFFDGLIWDGIPFGRDVNGNTDHYEVIGNVFEHPELLEPGKC